MDSFITKSKKLDRLITYSPSITPDYNIPNNQLVNNQLEPKGTKPTQSGTKL